MAQIDFERKSVVSPLWLSPGAEVFYVGSVNASDDARGDNWDRPLARVSKATVDKVATSAGGASGRGDIVYVGRGRYSENVRVVDRDGVRIIGAGIGVSTIAPGDTPTSANTDALGQSQTITLTNETTNQTDWAFIVGSRGIVITGFTIMGTGNAAGATGGMYIGDGAKLVAANDWGSSQFHIYDNFFDGEGAILGGWCFVWDGFGPGGIIENNYMARYASGGLLVTAGGNRRLTMGAIFRNNYIIGCRGYGVRRNPGYAGGNCVYDDNKIHDDGGSILTNGMLFSTISTGFGDLISNNSFGTSNAPISVSDAQDRLSGNKTSTAGSAAVTFVSMA